MFWEIFYTGTLWVIFEEVLDSAYKETWGDEIAYVEFIETLQLRRRIT